MSDEVPMSRPRLMPSDTPDYMAPAWVGCISWAIGNPEIRATFMTDSGLKWEPPKTELDRMIDKATGADERFIEAFIVWANDHVWGKIE